jgi:CRP-like cAMP-binding protein
MDPFVLAFLYGGLSALSLPLGAVFGLWLKPSLRVTAAVMAFGAGALFCALALELVVPALSLFPEDPMAGFKWLASGAMIGCILFISLDRLLADMGAYLRKASTITSRLRHVKKQHYRQILNKLSVLDLMVNLPPEEIRRVVSDVEKRSFIKGEVICHKEDPCDALFLIESGSVRVHSVASYENEQEVETVLSAGSAFGEMALLSGKPHISRAVAEQDAVLLEIHKDDFKEIVEVSPGLKKKLLQLGKEGQHSDSIPDISNEQSQQWLEDASFNLESELGHPTESEMINDASVQKSKGSSVALAIWLGIALDGIPESLIIGSSMEGSVVSLALVGGLFLANFPESMSSAVVMKRQGSKTFLIIMMWVSLMVMTAVGAALGNVFVSDASPQLHALLEGMAAGAMLAMIAQTMLPEAFTHGGWMTGLMTVIGFLAAIYMGTLDDERRMKTEQKGHVSTTIGAEKNSQAGWQEFDETFPGLTVQSCCRATADGKALSNSV